MDYYEQIASLKDLRNKYEKDLSNAQASVVFYENQLKTIDANKDSLRNSVIIDDTDVAFSQYDALATRCKVSRDEVVNVTIPNIRNKINEINDKITDLVNAAAAAEAAAAEEESSGDGVNTYSTSPTFTARNRYYS